MAWCKVNGNKLVRRWIARSQRATGNRRPNDQDREHRGGRHNSDSRNCNRHRDDEHPPSPEAIDQPPSWKRPERANREHGGRQHPELESADLELVANKWRKHTERKLRQCARRHRDGEDGRKSGSPRGRSRRLARRNSHSTTRPRRHHPCSGRVRAGAARNSYLSTSVGPSFLRGPTKPPETAPKVAPATPNAIVVITTPRVPSKINRPMSAPTSAPTTTPATRPMRLPRAWLFVATTPGPPVRCSVSCFISSCEGTRLLMQEPPDPTR